MLDVHRSADVHPDWNVHRDAGIDIHNHAHFWGGVAVGAATTLAVDAIVRALPPTHTQQRAEDFRIGRHSSR